MKLIHKAFKFRIYPTKDQKDLLAKHFGANRFIYNHYLDNAKKTGYTSYYKNALDLTSFKSQEEFSWLYEISNQSLQNSIKNLDTAFKNFFKKQCEFPVFKNKYGNQSFTFQDLKTSFWIKDKEIKIPKFKEPFKIIFDRKIEGKICYLTVSKTTTDKYFISITCEAESQPAPKTGSKTGIDGGIKELAILSCGKKYENIKPLKKAIKKLKFNQRQLSKKQKGSKQRKRQRKKLARLHEKVANIRKDYLHKVSTEIVKNHDIICVEDLALKNMMQNHCLAQAFSDAGLGMFYGMIGYKSDWNDKILVRINRFFPSSKTCNVCKYINKGLTLKDREWICPVCGTVHDRDINAARNILDEGLRILSGLGTKSDVKQKQGEALPQGESVTSDYYLV